MIIDDKIEKYFKNLKEHIEENKNIGSEIVYAQMKENMKLLGYKEISYDISYFKNIDVHTVKYHKFNNAFREVCIEYIVNVTIFDNDKTNESSLHVNYSEIKTTQKTLV